MTFGKSAQTARANMFALVALSPDAGPPHTRRGTKDFS